jgi:formylglycine-generating enzyme required for sulfatase activity
MPTSFPPPWASAWGTDRLSPYPFIELELAPGVGTRLRWIPPGQFLMGSPEDEAGRFVDEGPQHLVTLTKGYWLADAPCTQAEWQAVMGTAPSGFEGHNLPVENVSWDECQAFCERMRERFPGLQSRLPSEAEWEYACRATTSSAFNDCSPCTKPEGKDPALVKLGWFEKNSKETHMVRGLAANRWGLFDMHGNVWEWCADWSGDYTADDQLDPTGAIDGHGRVRRGGAWLYKAGDCRSACRSWRQPVERFLHLGFRIASGQ